MVGMLVQLAIFAQLLQDTSFNFGSPKFNFYTPYKIVTNSQLSHFCLCIWTSGITKIKLIGPNRVRVHMETMKKASNSQGS